MPPAPPSCQDFITIAEAARRFGWKRANTFREKFLSSEEEAAAMGLRYDEDGQGRALVRVDAVEAMVKAEKERRASRGNWRTINLAEHARRRPASDERVQRRRRRSTPGATE